MVERVPQAWGYEATQSCDDEEGDNEGVWLSVCSVFTTEQSALSDGLTQVYTALSNTNVETGASESKDRDTHSLCHSSLIISTVVSSCPSIFQTANEK